ncbi:hypothetical protein ABK040_002571 [Willaertia magna]
MYQLTTTLLALEANVSQGNKTVNNFGDYQIAVVGINGPFVPLYLLLFVLTLTSYLLQTKSLKRNQHILYSLLFVLLWCVILNLLTRIASELPYVNPDLNFANSAFFIVKSFDRTAFTIVLYVELLVMSFIGYIFLETTRAAENVSSQIIDRTEKALVWILGIILLIFIALCSIYFIFGGLMAAKSVDAATSNYLQIAIFLLAGVFFFICSVIISVLLNVFGFRLLISLQESKNKAVEMVHQKEDHDIARIETPKENYTVDIKKAALRRVLILQIGLTASFMFQLIGFIFVALSPVWKYFLVIFFGISNIGIIAFVLLLIGIYNPLREVQRTHSKGEKELKSNLTQFRESTVVTPVSNSETK